MGTTGKTYSLLPISGNLDYNGAKHLSERCLFGAKKSDVDALVGQSISSAINTLTTILAIPAPPVSMDSRDAGVSLGQTWINLAYSSTYNTYRLKSLRSWWIGNMMFQGNSLTEKMILFWHNHFAIETEVVNVANYYFNYIELLRKHALGNIKQLVYEMTIDPAMLVYLNGDANKVGAPNENYARELFELFTIGKGSMIADGNYTNYTETDIREAAKVLTGWKIDKASFKGIYDSTRHDKTTKTFSSVFNNQTIANKDADEYKLLVDMIFSKKETARYLVRKIYRWFMYYFIDKDIEDQIIEPLATTLYDNNYDIKPVLIKLFSSEHFFSQDYRGAYIKNPLEFTLGIYRKCEIPLAAELLTNYEIWYSIFSSAISMEMVLGDPPDVAGWPQYYKEPLFNELWVNSATVPNRTTFSDTLCNNGITKNGFKFVIDPFLLTTKISNPGDANALIAGLTQIILPVSLSVSKTNQLKETLIPGLPDSSWTFEWNKYIGNPSDATQKSLIRKKLLNVITAMLRMPEFYLC